MNNCAYCGIEIETGNFICSNCSHSAFNPIETDNTSTNSSKVDKSASFDQVQSSKKTAETITEPIEQAKTENNFTAAPVENEIVHLELFDAAFKKEIIQSKPQKKSKSSSSLDNQLIEKQQDLFELSKFSLDPNTSWSIQELHPDCYSKSYMLGFILVILPIVLYATKTMVCCILIASGVEIFGLVGLTVFIDQVLFLYFCIGIFIFRQRRNWLRFASWVHQNENENNAYFKSLQNTGHKTPFILTQSDGKTLYPGFERMTNIKVEIGDLLSLSRETIEHDNMLPVKIKAQISSNSRVLIIESKHQILWCSFDL